jgi:hypothetical protein
MYPFWHKNGTGAMKKTFDEKFSANGNKYSDTGISDELKSSRKRVTYWDAGSCKRGKSIMASFQFGHNAGAS